MYNLNEMIKPQAEGKVNSRLYSRTQKKKVQHSSAIKNNNNEAIVSLSSHFCLYVWTGSSKVSSKHIG